MRIQKYENHGGYRACFAGPFLPTSVRLGPAVTMLILCGLPGLVGIGHAQSSTAFEAEHTVSGLTGQWSALIDQTTYLGYSWPPREFAVSLSFRADGTYSYAVAQADPPAWQLNVEGTYAAGTAAPNRDQAPIELELTPGSVSLKGLSDANRQVELERLEYEDFPGIVNESFFVNWDTKGNLWLHRSDSFTPAIFQPGGNSNVQGPGYTTQYLLTQVADGGGWRTTFNLINPSTATVNYQLQLKDDSGSPLTLIAGNQTGSTFTGTLAPGASATLTSSAPNRLTQGIARVTATAPLVASGIFSSSAPGRPNFEAAVPALPSPAQSFLLPFDNQNGKATGVALANTGNADVNVTLTFRAETGIVFYIGTLSLATGSKTEFTLSGQFPPTSGQRGTVVIAAGTPVLAVLGLRFLPGGTFTSLPAYPLDSSSGNEPRQLLSHIVDGAGWRSIITIVNLDSQPATYGIRVFDTSGRPMAVNLNGLVAAAFTGNIPPLSSATLVTPGQSSNLIQGWADITSNQRIRAQLIFDSIAPGQPVFEAVVPAIGDGLTSLAIPYDNTSGLVTGLAVCDSGGTPANIQMTVRDESGAVITSKSISLGAGAKTAFVLTNVAPNSAGKRGLVQLTTGTSSISALALRFNGLGFTTLPVAATDR